MLELGLKAKDKITGFEGILTARHQYITGCDQYTITPERDDKGDLQNSYQFDEGRIETSGTGVEIKDVQSETKGGPQHPSLSTK
jgi:hypothetical protein